MGNGNTADVVYLDFDKVKGGMNAMANRVMRHLLG